MLQDHTAGDPMRQEVRWTDLTYEQIAGHLAEAGTPVSVPVVKQLLDEARLRHPQGPEVQGDGQPSRPQPAVREHRPAQAGVPGVGRPDREHGHQEEGADRQLLPGRAPPDAGGHRDVRPRLPQLRLGRGHPARAVRREAQRRPREPGDQPRHRRVRLRQHRAVVGGDRAGRSTLGRVRSCCCATAAAATAPASTCSRRTCNGWSIGWGSRSGWRTTRRTARSTTRSSTGCSRT